MGTVMKRKIKVKWKNLIGLLLFLFLLIFGLTEIVICIGKVLTTPKKNKPHTKSVEVISIEGEKLKKLNNINEKIDYFNMEYIDRYLAYKEKNTDMDITQVIKNVNMQLDKERYKDITSAKNLNTNKILVNKYYYADNYIPNNLETINTKYALNGMKMVKEAKEAFENLSKNAAKEGLNIIAMSTYRSYNYQVNLYNRYVKEDGKEKADTYSGRPGHSEHQTGLAVDVYNKKENYTNFEKTKEFNWMMEHAHEYGFILRFPKDKEKETGYIYESWHYRYVGLDAAKYIKENNISFEEYYATKIKDW